MRISGVVTRVFLPRGFAFIKGDDGNDYMVQANEWRGSWEGREIYGGARVEFAPGGNGGGGNGLRALDARAA